MRMSSQYMQVIAQATHKIGKRTLYARSDGRFFLRHQTRKTDTTYEVPPERVHLWLEQLR